MGAGLLLFTGHPNLRADAPGLVPSARKGTHATSPGTLSLGLDASLCGEGPGASVHVQGPVPARDRGQPHRGEMGYLRTGEVREERVCSETTMGFRTALVAAGGP